MMSQAMNLKEPHGHFEVKDATGEFVKEAFHSVGVLLGGFALSVLLVSLEGRKLYHPPNSRQP